MKHGNYMRAVAGGAGLCAAVLLTGCASSTNLETTWKAPEVGSIEFSKVLVLAAFPDGALRRNAEEAMKQEIQRIPSVAAYEVMPEVRDLRDRSRVAEAIKQSGADGLVVMRLISDRTEVTHLPGRPMPTAYTSFWGYYTRWYALDPFYWEPDRVISERVVGIETNIYNARDEQLIWSGYTRTRDPANIRQLVSEVAATVRERLRNQGLIPQ